MLDVTQQIIIESHRDGCSSLSRYCTAGPVLEQNFIQRDEVIDLAERLQMRSEHVDRHAGDNLAACRGKGSHAMGRPEQDGGRGFGRARARPGLPWTTSIASWLTRRANCVTDCCAR